MSKVGIRKIDIPQGVTVGFADNLVSVKGPKDEQSLRIFPYLQIEIADNQVTVTRKKEDKQTKSMHGLTRKLIENMIIGCWQGFQKKLDYKGVGFRAEVTGSDLTLNVGFSHPVIVKAPEGIEFKVEKNIITVSGTDRQKVGQMAAEIRAIKPVEPYKGKGIKYIDEIPHRKPGKAAKAASGTA